MRISINPAPTSHGRGGLEGDRPSGSHEQHFLTEGQPAAPIPTIHSRSRKFPLRYRSRPFEEVWRAPGPPAPTSIIFSQKVSLPPPYRPYTAEVGNFRSGIVHAHSKRSGGRPALRLPRASNSRGSLNIRLPPDRIPQKSEIAAPVSFTPIRDSRATFPFCHAMFFSLHEVENMHAICRYTQLAKKENQDYT